MDVLTILAAADMFTPYAILVHQTPLLYGIVEISQEILIQK